MQPRRVFSASTRRELGGVLIAAMIATVVLGDLAFGDSARLPALIAGTFAWAAAIALLPDVSRTQLIVISVIAAVGIALIYLAMYLGAAVKVGDIASGNARLLAMIAAVGFLRLVAIAPSAGSAGLPKGRGAFLKTILGVSLFGSVINISAPILVADRLAGRTGLDRFATQSITRVFSGCSAWSPFYGGMAAVLTYVPNADLLFLMAACLPFALFGLMVVALEARFRYPVELAGFSGYPLGLANLWVPLLLAGAVIVLSVSVQGLSILTAIACGSLSVTAAMLVARGGVRSSLVALAQHVTEGLPGMVNELLLFLTAGIIATGLSSLVSTGLLELPEMGFTALTAFGILGVMLGLACLGVHPLIIISGATPVLLSLEPPPDLLAVMYLLAWSMGTSASPLSGTHLVFQGRYGVPSWRGAVWNWPYVAVMYLFSFPFLQSVAQWA